MYEQVDKAKENRSTAVVNAVAQKKNDKQGLRFVDNRPKTIVQLKLQKIVNGSYPASEAVTQRVLDGDQLGDAWDKVEKYAKKCRVELTDEVFDIIEGYFNAKKTPEKAADAIGGARALIDKMVSHEKPEAEEVEKTPGWKKKGKSGAVMGSGERDLRKRNGHGMMTKEQARRYVPEY